MASAPLSYPQHLRAVIVLGLPLVGGHLAQFAIGLTDTVMVGWYGVAELAALTLAHTVFMVFFLFGSGFAFAVMPMVASYAAQGDETRIRRVTRMGLWLSIGFFALSMPVFWFSGPILRALGQDAELARMAQTYLRIAGLGLLPALGVMVLKSYLAALEETRAVFLLTALAALLNVPFNYVLIFGNFGFQELGIAGAAIASVLTHCVALAGAMVFSDRKLPQHDLFGRFWVSDPESLREVFRLGWPIGVTNLSEVGLFAVSSIFMGWLGTVPLAAHGIALQLATAAFMIHLGLSNAATVRAGNAFGAGDPLRLARGAVAALGLSAAVSLVAMVVMVAAPEPLISLFLDPAEPDRAAIIVAGTGLLITAALFQLVDGAQVITLGLLRGVQDTRVPMWMAAVAYWALGLPAAWIGGFVLGWGGVGVWLGLVTGLGAAAIMLLFRFWARALPTFEATGQSLAPAPASH
ncbi:multidrug resistance protein, MATE family [Roseivivax halotolerans]|uniref:Multidrug-efflux transporter n=1 Tax=Roseivivax halotolerans TaxID=93684 RepID=A0A1I5Y7F9_9RHOB|nr:MATE family efflux transporter [Roseivivax halotolerans]SFQ40104.1 multidrug resistance protein, MATE family [Roseivivax halotolerans]